MRLAEVKSLAQATGSVTSSLSVLVILHEKQTLKRSIAWVERQKAGWWPHGVGIEAGINCRQARGIFWGDGHILKLGSDGSCSIL